MSPLLRHETARLSVALLFAACAASAAAETVQLRYVSPAIALATPLHLPPGTQSYYAGSYNLQIQAPAMSFQAYCVDPFQYVSTGYLAYEESSLASFLSASAQRRADVTHLIAHGYADSLGSATKAAGFQLALWEVFNDDKNVTSGSVRKTSNTNAAVVAEANSLLASLAASSWTAPAASYELTIYSNGQKQDFLAATPVLVSASITPVPEPEVAVLTLTGLGLLGLVALRRRKSATPI